MTSSPDPAADLQRIREYWDDRATALDSDCAKVDASRRAQKMRFEAFVLNHELSGKRILDVGCGVGDFSEHLRARGINCTYLGYDLSPKMIARCQQRYPDVAFESGDILQQEFDPPFDYVVAFAIHNNVKVANGRELLERITRRQFDLCRVATHLSLLTDRYRGFAPHMQSWRAEEVLSMALDITPYVVLRHDYLPNDFGITLYREPLIDTRKDLLLR